MRTVGVSPKDGRFAEMYFLFYVIGSVIYTFALRGRTDFAPLGGECTVIFAAAAVITAAAAFSLFGVIFIPAVGTVLGALTAYMGTTGSGAILLAFIVPTIFTASSFALKTSAQLCTMAHGKIKIGSIFMLLLIQLLVLLIIFTIQKNFQE